MERSTQHSAVRKDAEKAHLLQPNLAAMGPVKHIIMFHIKICVLNIHDIIVTDMPKLFVFLPKRRLKHILVLVVSIYEKIKSLLETPVAFWHLQ